MGTELNVNYAYIPEEFQNSLDKIIEYAELNKTDALTLKGNLEKFRRLKDKIFVDTATRELRSQISRIFFAMYPMVWKKAVAANDNSRLINCFLKYGFLDERLLRPEQVVELYELADRDLPPGRFSVFDIRSWLEAIYKMEREPSINEMGMDYSDLFREGKKRGLYTDQDKARYDADAEGRLNHEINSLLKTGQCLCCGRMSDYFPVLHSQAVIGSLKDTIVTSEKVQASLEKIMAVDFSVFYREVVFNHTAQGMGAEIIMKSVLPEIILLPVFGERGIMWQEITGKVKSSPARFVLPIFTAESLDKMLISIVAKFRWELSRSMSGYSRNSGVEHSLYNDYTDYLQFFAKNRELSEEVKIKIKNQIKKNRNQTVNIFAADYSDWINFEYQGMLRLNKVNRAILFKYCPFSQEYRSRLESHPVYGPLISQFTNIRNRKLRELQARYARLRAIEGNLASDLQENLAYYQF